MITEAKNTRSNANAAQSFIVWKKRAHFALLIAAGLTLFPYDGSAQDRTVTTSAGLLRVEPVARMLEHPWGMAFLPDGRMLVTERPGQLRIVSPNGEISAPVQGVPDVYAEGQGGLLDVALDPNHEANALVYLTYAEAGDGGASTAVARARLDGAQLRDVNVIFRQQPKVSGDKHFGSRIAFAPDGTMFVTLAERFKFEPAQDLSNHLGTIVRINPDGSVPKDNPFVGKENARPEIWSYGHRNIQGADIHPDTGMLWISEFGPRGGDELNVPEAGKNYGWPLVSWGRHYTFIDIPDPTTRPDLAGSVYYWNPVISPSGITFYTGDALPAWKGNLLIAGLTAQGVVRLALDGTTVVDEERIPIDRRVRDVEQGLDGNIYILIDESDGAILRLRPAQ